MNKTIASLTVLFCFSAGLAADAEKDFNDLFGTQIKQAAGTTSTKDDLELAGFMLSAVEEIENRRDLKVLMCAKAAELAARNPGGADTALSALKQLATLAPERSDEWAARRVDVYQTLYINSRGAARLTAGKALLAEQLRAGDAMIASGRGSDALAMYRKALAIAGVVGGEKRKEIQKEIQDKIKNATEAAAAQRRIESLEARLKKDPSDTKARENLILVYLLEHDDGIRASKLLTKDVDDFLQTVVPLAAKSVVDVPAAECRDMGQWYHQQAEKATTQLRKAVAARRVRDYFAAYLPVAGSGIDKLKAKLRKDTAAKDLTEKYASVKMPARRVLPPEKKVATTTTPRPAAPETTPAKPDPRPGKSLESFPTARMPPGEWEPLLTDKYNVHKWSIDYDADVAKKVVFKEGIMTVFGDTSLTHFRNFDDLILSAGVQQSGEGGTIGLRVRPSSAGFYGAWFDGKRTFGIGKYTATAAEDEEKWKTIKTVLLSKPAVGFFTMAIGAIGNKITLYVDEKKIAEFEDKSFKSGIPVLYAENSKEAKFRNVRILIPEKK